jgi:hypothetical protein
VHLLTFKSELGETPCAGESTSQQTASGLLSCASACAAAVTLGKIIAMARTFIASSLISGGSQQPLHPPGHHHNGSNPESLCEYNRINIVIEMMPARI